MDLGTTSFIERIVSKASESSAYSRDVSVEDAVKKVVAQEFRSLFSGSDVSTDTSAEREITARRLLAQSVEACKIVLGQTLSGLDSVHIDLHGCSMEGNNPLFLNSRPLIKGNNAPVNFNTLPDDVLSEIYHFAIASSCRAESCTAIRLSGVNAKSREMVLSRTSFWSTLSTKLRPEVNLLSVERSGTSLLVVHLSSRHSYFKDVLETFHGYCHRFGGLRFYDSDSWLQFWEVFGNKKSMLTSFSLLDVRGINLDNVVCRRECKMETVLTSSISDYSGQWFYHFLHEDGESQWSRNLRRCSLQLFGDNYEEYEPFYYYPICESLELQFLLNRAFRQRNSANFYDDEEYGDFECDDRVAEEYATYLLREFDPDDPSQRSKISLGSLRRLSILVEHQENIYFAELTLRFMPLNQLHSLKVELNFRITTEDFLDIFTTYEFTALKTFELVFPHYRDSGRCISLQNMPNLESLILRGISGLSECEGYVQEIRRKVAIRTVLFDNCGILESELVNLAEALSDTSRYRNFSKLHLTRCFIQSFTLRRLNSVLNSKFRYER